MVVGVEVPTATILPRGRWAVTYFFRRGSTAGTRCEGNPLGATGWGGVGAYNGVLEQIEYEVNAAGVEVVGVWVPTPREPMLGWDPFWGYGWGSRMVTMQGGQASLDRASTRGRVERLG